MPCPNGAVAGLVLAGAAGFAALAGDLSVTVRCDRIIGKSALELGVTHTHLGLDSPDAKGEAVERAVELLRRAARWQNTHIIGWGVGDVNPSPGRYDWATLDRRITLMRRIGLPMVVTLCTAPGWMKRSGDTWRMEEAPAPEHFADFARLCVEVARRYPDVRRYQVWNEFKGFWSRETNNWDAPAYTRLYNTVHEALKRHDPGLAVGGLYLVVQGTGSAEFGKTGADTFRPVGEKDGAVLEYWLRNMRGADFVCLDRGVKDYHDPNAYTSEELMKLTHLFGDVCRQVSARAELPVWWSEYYGFGRPGSEELAAAYASIYVHMVRSGAAAALLWNPNEGEIPHHLFTDVRRPDGGRPSPHYEVFRLFAECFAPGTPLCEALCSSEDVEVLASPDRTLLVNKTASERTLRIAGLPGRRSFRLGPYHVRTLNNR